jgi:protein-tyrosine phosphatase
VGNFVAVWCDGFIGGDLRPTIYGVMSNKIVLFICTGNYYRSRFAEYLFNTLAERQGMAWRAQSRGLSTAVGKWKAGPISAFAVAALKERGIAMRGFVREPLFCCEEDICRAERVIALKEAEHRPMLEKGFPEFCRRIEFWHVHDVDIAHPDQALGEVDGLVRKLMGELS